MNNVRTLRQQRRLTQSELASKIGADKHYISKVENGRVSPRYPMQRKLTKALGLKLSQVEEVFPS